MIDEPPDAWTSARRRSRTLAVATVENVGREGIELRLPDGTTFGLPPDLRGVESAPPGTYRLRSTGEQVEDPDFLCRWTVTRPDA